MKRPIFLYFFAFAGILTLCAAFSGCNPGGGAIDYSGTVSVSAGVGSAATSAGINSRAYVLEPMSSEEYYKADRKSGARGQLRTQLTPERFILDIDILALYNVTETSPAQTTKLSEMVQNPDGALIPQHIDLVYADDFIRDVEITEATFNGISMQVQPQGNNTSNDGYYVRSLVGVSLPSEYDGKTLSGEYDGIPGLPADLRFFSFADLQPFETNDGFLSYLTIGSDIAEDSIQNPNGEMGTWEVPLTETNGNAVSLFFPLEEDIDFSPYENPEICFNWDMTDLVEIYDAGTPDIYTDDIVTFKVDDPFPVSLTIQENEADPSPSGDDTTPPNDVIAAAISGPTTYNTLQWINPIDEDFDKLVVVRKAGSAPADKNDGEVVYDSYKPNYVDSTGTSGTDYYYTIYAVDRAGNYSAGVTLNQVQP